jgi:hypothetical protein
MATTAQDPIQAQVERVLRAIVVAPIAVPLAVVTFVPRCVLRQVGGICRRLREPARVVRALIDLMGAGSVRSVVEPDDVPPPDEPAAPGLRLVGDEPPSRPSREHLPIDEYESLAASQVVARLPTLTEAELEEVRSFEAAHRGRRTILGKIEQLLA